jgi:hypothetical protein
MKFFEKKEWLSSETLFIPEGITHISDFLFSNHLEIKTIVFPSTLKNIGRNAFSGCKALQSIFIPFVSFIDIEAFQECVELKCIQGAMKGCSFIGKRAFLGCINLQKIDLTSTSLKVLPFHVFFHCSHLVHVYLPFSLLHVRKEAFAHCTSLREIKFLEKIKTLEENSFLYCFSLQTLYFENSHVIPHPFAFNECILLSRLFLSPYFPPHCLFLFPHLKTVIVDDLTHFLNIQKLNIQGIQIFFHDMLKMHHYMSLWKKEMMETFFHPQRLERWLLLGGELDDF